MGVHFYTSNRNERNYIYNSLDNYAYEGASYVGVESLDEAAFAQTSGSGTAPVSVHRFFNRISGTHLYTVSDREKNFVEAELDNFRYEGEAFNAYNIQVEGSIPIYRFYNSSTGAHFYTPSTAEKDYVDRELSNFQAEGIAYYALPLEAEI